MGRRYRYAGSSPQSRRFLIRPPGTQFSTNARDNSFEQNIQSLSELEESLELTALLLQILVIDPLRRPDVPEILDHPWFMGSPSPAAPSGSASE